MNRILITLAAAMLLPLATLAQQAPAPTAAQIANGQLAYTTAGCYLCHGTVGQGGAGPKLTPQPFPVEALTAFVRVSPGSMPPYPAHMLSDADLRDIHAFLVSRPASPPASQIPLLK